MTDLNRMPRRNSPNQIRSLADLSHLSEWVLDKRRGQRAAAKKHRRNRHYEKQFIRNTLAHPPTDRTGAEPDAQADVGRRPGPSPDLKDPQA